LGSVLRADQILARRQAAKQVPVDHERFKQLLENGVAPAASN
jgi:hypothetical protein